MKNSTLADGKYGAPKAGLSHIVEETFEKPIYKFRVDYSHPKSVVWSNTVMFTIPTKTTPAAGFRNFRKALSLIDCCGSQWTGVIPVEAGEDTLWNDYAAQIYRG